MATVPAGYTAGAPANGVIPLYNAGGMIAGTIANGQTNLLDSNSTQAEKSAAYAFPSEIGVSASQVAGTGQAAASPQSYLTGTVAPATQNNSMATNSPSAGQASPQQMLQYFVSQGGSPYQDPSSIAQYYQARQAQGQNQGQNQPSPQERVRDKHCQ